MKTSETTYGTSSVARVRWILYKEISSFFGSNIAPLAMGLTALMCGMVSVLLTLVPNATYEQITAIIFHLFYIAIIITAVFLSMTAFVPEKKQGTMELLYTLPVSDLELTLGKFLMGAGLLTLISILMTLVYVLGIADAPWYMAVSGAIGLTLVAFYAYSVGVFASSLTESYLLSLLISATLLISLEVTGFLSGLMPSPAREILTHLHGLNHFTPFARGRIPFKGAMFFLSFTGFFLFLTVRTLESRRWRG